MEEGDFKKILTKDVSNIEVDETTSLNGFIPNDASTSLSTPTSFALA